MSMDVIGNLLTIIRNAVAVAKRFVVVPYSRMNENIAKILKAEGFIRDYSIEQGDSFSVMRLVLKYKDGESVIHEIKRVSTPGRRLYTACKDIKPVIGGLGITILTTPRGILSHKEARVHGVGGEIICTVW